MEAVKKKMRKIESILGGEEVTLRDLIRTRFNFHTLCARAKDEAPGQSIAYLSFAKSSSISMKSVWIEFRN